MIFPQNYITLVTFVQRVCAKLHGDLIYTTIIFYVPTIYRCTHVLKILAIIN